MTMSARYADKVVLVTAGASGIGAATVEAFGREGARIMVSDINTTGGEAIVERLRREGVDARFLQADATVEEDIERLIRTTAETFGALHVAANVVGDVHPHAAGPEFHLQSLESWEATVAVSLRSVFLSMKHEISHMIEHGGGAICNVTSLSGLLHVPESGAAYAASKAGVIRLTKFAAINYAERGVRVNCIAPGVTPTPAYYKGGEAGAKMLIERMLEGHAIKRVIEPQEQAAAIVWLCSNEAAMVTGHVLPVDGGWTAR
jgi:NAD(P)-dependent dehydrogenase (short-subunit alcohol dehydrogenase family)